jgi:ketosteroid isomerase-like protein
VEGVKSKVEQLFQAFNERNLGGILELCDPEVEFLPVTAVLALDGRAYAGHEGIRRYFADVARVWDELKVTAADVREADDAVLVLGRVVAHSKGQGTRDLPAGWVLRLSADRFVYGRVYADPRDAERALGVENAQLRD